MQGRYELSKSKVRGRRSEPQKSQVKVKDKVSKQVIISYYLFIAYSRLHTPRHANLRTTNPDCLDSSVG